MQVWGWCCVRHFFLDIIENLFKNPLSAGSLDSGLTIQQKKNSDNQIEEFFLFGDKKNTHLLVSGISTRFFGYTNGSRQDAGVEMKIKKINLLITTGKADSFIAKILPSTGVNATFELGIGISLQRGLHFERKRWY